MLKSSAAILLFLPLMVLTGGHFYQRFDKIDIAGLSGFLTVYKNNTAAGCITQCNSIWECNMVTHTQPNVCKLYNVVAPKSSLLTFSKITSSKTTLLVKSKRSINQPCKRAEQCMQEIGLTCKKNQCACTIDK